MPGNESEIPILVREFTGVDIQTDPAFLSEDMLQASQNMIPDFTYLIRKRFGTKTDNLSMPVSLSDGLPWLHPRIDVMRWALAPDNATNLIYWVVTTVGDGIATAAGDRLMVAVGYPRVLFEIYNFGNATPPVSGGRYGMTILGQKLYVGNGVSPLISIPLGTPAGPPAILDAIGQFNTAAVGTPAGGGSLLQGVLPGTYSYRWAYLDQNGMWQAQSQTQTVVAALTGSMSISFAGPTDAEIATTTPTPSPLLAPIDANNTVHLFLSPANLPIEYARDQGFLDKSGDAMPPPTLVVNQYNDQGDLVPLQGAAYTGRYLVRHRGRVWIAGNQAAGTTSRLYATNVIVPGLEQQLYNYGDFFPSGANAPINNTDGDVITGLGLAQGSQNRDVASSPLVIFKNAAIYLWFGDIVDDDQAQLVQVSDSIGCAAGGTIVSTSEGVIFMGRDSVYYLGTGFDEPLDIGIPIRPAIEDIPKGRLAFATATYHRGWYKLAITPPGGISNTIEWWFDLRISTGTNDVLTEAHWWGPHLVTPFSAFAVGILDPAEFDRLYAGRENPPNETPPRVDVCITDQEHLYFDLQSVISGGTSNVPIQGRLRTGGLIQNEPFQWKDWVSVRLVTLPDSDSPVKVTVYADGGSAQMLPTMNQNQELDPALEPSIILANANAAIWDVSLWDVGLWGQRLFVEGWSEIAPVLRSHSLEVELTHPDPVGLLMRDVEVRYRPVQRRAPGAV